MTTSRGSDTSLDVVMIVFECDRGATTTVTATQPCGR